ncbi:Gfo/Idh/MocA family protein [Paenibacillus cymbidii]|uniref:Gfo/Idh/MocA family protein n=1 Tax=Paenibacillus cymbidii TaxID=1639034 RepID=UPI001080BF84|nr:Gfo/Idh/MocA family oxidoreductase [Paenibacillus cymbidii]
MKCWGVAVIGCGGIGSFHLKSVQELEQARLIGIHSRSAERARAIGEREGCLWTTDYRELLQHPDVDAVCVTTSSGSHYAIGMEVLQAGKHLLVEKPLAMNAQQARAMIAEAASRGLTLAVVSQRRFEPQTTAIKQAVSSGAIGELLFVEAACPYWRDQAYYDSASWRGTIAEDGGALMNQGIHIIDLMLWMAGEAKSVFAKTATQLHQMEAEDFGLALITFRNGAFGKLLASTNLQPGFPQSLHLYGSKGTIKLEANRIVHWTVPGVEPPESPGDDFHPGGVAIPNDFPIDQHKRQIADWLDSAGQGRRPLVAGEDGLRALSLIEAIYESAARGSEIEIQST